MMAAQQAYQRQFTCRPGCHKSLNWHALTLSLSISLISTHRGDDDLLSSWVANGRQPWLQSLTFAHDASGHAPLGRRRRYGYDASLWLGRKCSRWNGAFNVRSSFPTLWRRLGLPSATARFVHLRSKSAAARTSPGHARLRRRCCQTPVACFEEPTA